MTESRNTILVIDDAPENLALINGLLRDFYRVKVATNGERGINLALAEPVPDLILLDVMMAGMDGWEVCRRLKAAPQTAGIPVIFLTACVNADDERLGLELGAVDYITKPINPPVLLARVRGQLTIKASADLLRDQNAYLEREVALRTQRIQQVQDISIMALAALAETRDNDTGNHIRRTQRYVEVLARQLQCLPKFAESLSDAFVQDLFRSAPLHDIGKVGIPDRILLKPGRLEQEEMEIMKTHAELGRRAIEIAEAECGERIDFLKIAKDIAYAHHERWDGKGYPQQLAGDAIPLSARLMALADVYDALISARVYKPAMSHEAAAAIILAEQGKQFDPDVVDAFVARQEDFMVIARRYSD